MASDDKKTKADPAPKTKADPVAKSDASKKDKSTADAKSTVDAKSTADAKSGADAAPAKAEGGEKEAGSPSGYHQGRGPEAGDPSLQRQLEPDLREKKKKKR